MHTQLALSRPYTVARDIALILAGTLALAVSAKVQIPFWPVPMTLQTLVVLLIGAQFGVKRAGLTILAYILEGTLGLPVFGAGVGLATLVGPTGGYLVGFVGAAVLTAFAGERGVLAQVSRAWVVFLLADALILTLGWAWLSGFVGMNKAFALGVVPFLQAEALKIALASAAMALIRRR
jgi:biotin transport system substrate-specific component